MIWQLCVWYVVFTLRSSNNFVTFIDCFQCVLVIHVISFSQMLCGSFSHCGMNCCDDYNHCRDEYPEDADERYDERDKDVEHARRYREDKEPVTQRDPFDDRETEQTGALRLVVVFFQALNMQHILCMLVFNVRIDH